MTTNEKIFSSTPVNNDIFGKIEARRYAKLKQSPKKLFNPTNREAKPLEVGYETTKKSLGL